VTRVFDRNVSSLEVRVEAAFSIEGEVEMQSATATMAYAAFLIRPPNRARRVEPGIAKTACLG
jgi:hypothetical protein